MMVSSITSVSMNSSDGFIHHLMMILSVTSVSLNTNDGIINVSMNITGGFIYH